MTADALGGRMHRDCGCLALRLRVAARAIFGTERGEHTRISSPRGSAIDGFQRVVAGKGVTARAISWHQWPQPLLGLLGRVLNV